MMNHVLIKFGGSVITDKSKPMSVRRDVIRRLADELIRARKDGLNDGIILGTGGGSFGHGLAEQYAPFLSNVLLPEARESFKRIHSAVSKLNGMIVDACNTAGLSACSIRLADCLQQNENFVFTFENFLPVFYGDIILRNDGGSYEIVSTEKIFDMIIDFSTLFVRRVIMVTDVDGFLDDERNVVPLIGVNDGERFLSLVSESKHADVTGGMLHKIQTALGWATRGIETFVINGLVPDRLYNVLLGRDVTGTIIR